MEIDSFKVLGCDDSIFPAFLSTTLHDHDFMILCPGVFSNDPEQHSRQVFFWAWAERCTCAKTEIEDVKEQLTVTLLVGDLSIVELQVQMDFELLQAMCYD